MKIYIKTDDEILVATIAVDKKAWRSYPQKRRLWTIVCDEVTRALKAETPRRKKALLPPGADEETAAYDLGLPRGGQ